MKFFIVFMLLWSITLNAQVKIHGTAKGFENKTLKVIVLKDLITEVEKQVAQVTINNEGGFDVELTLSETQQVYLEIDKYRGDLFVKKQGNYDLNFPHKDSLLAESDNVLNQKFQLAFNKPYQVSLEVKVEPIDVLNAKINEFNADYEEFQNNNLKELIRQRKRIILDTFALRMEEKYKSVQDSFFKDFMNYRLVQVEQFAQLKDVNRIIEEQFQNKPVLYSNPEYMFVLKQVYQGLFKKEALNIDTLMRIAVNQHKSMIEIDNYLSIKRNFTNPRIRELITLQGMMELFYMKEFKQESIFEILNQIEQNTKFNEHKELAKNIKDTLKKLYKDTQAPVFELPILGDSIISLSDFEGKFLYLLFWNSDYASSVQNVISMNNLKEKYGEKVSFLAICTDKETSPIQSLQNEYQLTFPMAHISNRRDLLDQYNVCVYPTAILINPEGKIYMAPAKTMIDVNELDRMFYYLFKE